ncbi:MAG: hypothetical protein WAQ52_09695 [Terriglobales bacterium]
MNFTSRIRQDEVAVELKYCERCGGLWLRRQGQEVVYCGGCRAQMAALLCGRRRRFEPRVAPNQVQIERLLGVAEAEVRS